MYTFRVFVCEWHEHETFNSILNGIKPIRSNNYILLILFPHSIRSWSHFFISLGILNWQTLSQICLFASSHSWIGTWRFFMTSLRNQVAQFVNQTFNMINMSYKKMLFGFGFSQPIHNEHGSAFCQTSIEIIELCSIFTFESIFLIA